MNVFGLILLFVGALCQTTQAQCIRTCGYAPTIAVPGAITTAPGTTIIQAPSVANALADTLSLLTVSSLLADALPLPCGPIVTVPAVPAVSYSGCGCGLPAVPAVSYSGCGCGCGLSTAPAVSYSGCGLSTAPAVSYSGCGLPAIPALNCGGCSSCLGRGWDCGVPAIPTVSCGGCGCNSCLGRGYDILF